MMRARIARRVHQLHRQIDALGRRVGPLGGEDVLLAQDRARSLDHQPGSLIAIGDDGLANQNAFVGLELDLERHGVISWLPDRGATVRLFPFWVDDLKRRWRLRVQTPSFGALT